MGQVVELSSDEAHHLVHVCRKRKGDLIQVFDVDSSQCYLGTVLDVRKQSAAVEVLSEIRPQTGNDASSAVGIVGMARPNVLSSIVEKCVELGGAKIHFFFSERSQAKERLTPALLSRLERVAYSAAKQSGSSQLPEIFAHPSLESALIEVHESQNKQRSHCPKVLFLKDAPNLLKAIGQEGQSPVISSFLSRGEPPDNNSEYGLENNPRPVDAYFIIGPEGGLTGSELELAGRWGYLQASLGANTLRVETAYTVACAIIQLITTTK